jgi:hypothetical protein
MSLFHRWLLVPAPRAALLAGLAASCVTLVVWRGTGLFSLPGADGSAGQAPPSGQGPDEPVGRAVLRFARKERLAAEVIDGRLSLPEAAARFLALDENDPEFNWTAFRLYVPGRSDDERYCRQVIRYVEGQLQGRTAVEPGLAERLEAELQDLLDRGGPALPAWPSP